MAGFCSLTDFVYLTCDYFSIGSVLTDHFKKQFPHRVLVCAYSNTFKLEIKVNPPQIKTMIHERKYWVHLQITFQEHKIAWIIIRTC